MKKLVLGVLLVAALAFTGCASAPSVVNGALFTSSKGPVQVVDNSVKPLKEGRATAKSILGLVAQGDASIAAAMANGDITKIHHVDYESNVILGIISDCTIVVYGE